MPHVLRHKANAVGLRAVITYITVGPYTEIAQTVIEFEGFSGPVGIDRGARGARAEGFVAADMVGVGDEVDAVLQLKKSREASVSRRLRSRGRLNWKWFCER